MNFRLTLQYDGTDFHGWQMQGAMRTVQGELTRVLSMLEGKEVVVHGAGRTDAGVHAEGQVANVNLERNFSTGKLRAAINGNLERDLRVIDVEIVPDDFHARFSASGKTYCYRIFNAPFISPFWVRYAYYEGRNIDINLMKRSANLFVGKHDWTAFSAAQSDVKTRVRTITALDISESWSNRGQGRIIKIIVSADGFLRYMVRSIVGTLLEIGRGAMSEDVIKSAIGTGDRSLAGETAPAHGLTLIKVHYQ
jgi:tRNA pseudouridine38-40 synthase